LAWVETRKKPLAGKKKEERGGGFGLQNTLAGNKEQLVEAREALSMKNNKRRGEIWFRGYQNRIGGGNKELTNHGEGGAFQLKKKHGGGISPSPFPGGFTGAGNCGVFFFPPCGKVILEGAHNKKK